MILTALICRGGAILALAATFGVAGCTHAYDGPKNAPASVAERLGVPGCRVSVPMSQAEVLANAKRDGDPHTEGREEWLKIVATSHPGDELRKVACLKSGRYGSAGDMYFGLFRNGAMIAKLNYIIIN